MLIRELQEFNRLFAQIDILHQKLTEFWSRDTLICEGVLGNLTPTPPGVEFWRTNMRFYCAGHRKTRQQQNVSICRVTISLCEMKDLEKQ